MPPKKTSIKTVVNARQLRQDATIQEKCLWEVLRSHRFDGIKFRRQHPVGEFIVDFCSPAQKLIIELDGSQHLDQAGYDAKRTRFLESKGYRVLRFWNYEIDAGLDGVVMVILDAAGKGEHPSDPAPFHFGGA